MNSLIVGFLYNAEAD